MLALGSSLRRFSFHPEGFLMKLVFDDFIFTLTMVMTQEIQFNVEM